MHIHSMNWVLDEFRYECAGCGFVRYYDVWELANLTGVMVFGGLTLSLLAWLVMR